MFDLIYPKTCYFCLKEGEFLCVECFRKYIKIDPINRCHVCNKESRIGFVHRECEELSYLSGVINLTSYEKIIKKVIYDFKYNYFYSISSSLGKIMADYLQFYNFDISNSIITFVPSSQKKLKIRGFNQSDLLAKSLSKCSLFKRKALLIKTKNTGAQAKLHKLSRAENLKNAFKLRLDIEIQENVKNILIVDDVFTTGATLNECAKLIKNSYPSLNVFGFVIAKARN